ncbi:ACT domain-containing protein [Thermoanaerobacterium sp. RBIITD]|uniref:ACT domain-containing protein n=1 Tax=Thermoanaerobacterium sp. RBIITD TaxID=1550240 RepID=UPI000BB7BBD0|nr:ACT domain-containing protein [Thermoanaerobacterium sp. RBIITD]SNX53608.1 chorismate mutase [Thermoanaerobacterium sp. RBIITD]
MGEDSKLYIIREEILSDALKKTLKVKELIETGEAKTVNDAVKKVGMSRSAFYKYRDYIFPYSKFSKGKIITLSLLLEHMPGILSSILDIIASLRGNVITINQSMPSLGVASVSISVDTQYMEVNIESLIKKIEAEHGVRKIEILGE